MFRTLEGLVSKGVKVDIGIYNMLYIYLMFRTLEGLVSKGVKVDIGIPHELWDKPSAEITQVRFPSI